VQRRKSSKAQWLGLKTKDKSKKTKDLLYLKNGSKIYGKLMEVTDRE